MKNPFKLLSDVTFTTDTKMKDLIRQAREDGANEERKYYDDGDVNSGGRLSEVQRWDKQFYTMVEHFNEDPYRITTKDKKGKSIRDVAKEFIENITGGFIIVDSARGRIFKKSLTVDELSLLQDAIFIKAQSDPHAQSIINNIEYYTIGKGTRIDCQVPKVKKVIDEFRFRNNMEQREKKMVRAGFMKGEYFVHLIEGEKGDLLVRSIDPSEIREIDFGDDVESPKAYKREWADSENAIKEKWIADIKYFQLLNDKWVKSSSHIEKEEKDVNRFIQYVKYGEDGEPRARPPMASILKWLKYYDNWLIDRMILNHERSKVVWIREIRGRSTTNQRINPMASPKGGIMLEETENVRYRVESAKLESRDAKEDGNAILYMIGAFRNIPIHILHQDASESVYASIRSVDSPFGQMITSNQDFWSDHWRDLHRFVIHRKVLASELQEFSRVPIFEEKKLIETLVLINEEVVDGKMKDEDILKAAKEKLGKIKKISVRTEEVIVNQTFPQMGNDNPLDIAKVLKLHKEMGIVSNSTLSSRAGYDWLSELGKLKSEQAMGVDQFGSSNPMVKDESGQDDERDRGSNAPTVKRK